VDPAPQSPDKVPTQVWQAAFEKNIQLAESASPDLDVVLLGDSITEHLAGTELGQPEETWERHSAVFDQLFTRDGGGEIDGMALGIGGDASAQLLYRLQNGELPSIFSPKVWWVLIGTNDLSDSCSAEATLMGILAVLEEIRLQRPSAKIVINSILPRPRNSVGTLSGIVWIKSVWINQRLECYASGYSNLEYFDASDIFLNKDHTKAIKNHYAPDWIHPSAFGTQKWGEAIVEKVKELINS
jgi:lysophospholipase L1-like esterase